MDNAAIYRYIDSQEQQALALWEHLVRWETPSADKERLDGLAAHLDTYFSAMGLATRKYSFERAGASIAAWTAPGELKPVVFSGHLDTVHPVGSFGSRLFVRDAAAPDRIIGPGIYDCKGGVAAAVLAVRALQQAGYKKRQLKLVFVGDEEVAHELSEGRTTEVFRSECSGAACAFNCESAPLNGGVVTGRKGGGTVRITVRGVSAHSGREPQLGASAIAEAARKILRIEALNKPDYSGVLYNCGVVHGGTGSNVIPGQCSFDVGLRFASSGEYEEAMARLRQICADNADARVSAQLQVAGLYQAMEKAPGTDRLLSLYRRACRSLGYEEPEEQYSGGCSDASFISQLGVPVLCCVGVRGALNHTPEEYALASSLTEQAKKLAAAVLSLPDDF